MKVECSGCRYGAVGLVCLLMAAASCATPQQGATTSPANPAAKAVTNVLEQVSWYYGRRMHAPKFEFTPVEGAEKYRCTLTWTEWTNMPVRCPMSPDDPPMPSPPVPAKNKARAQYPSPTLETKSMVIMSSTPVVDTAPVWTNLPTASRFHPHEKVWAKAGQFKVLAEALDRKGNVLAARNFGFTRVAPFEGGYYRPGKMGYDESAERAIKWAMERGAYGIASGYPALYANAYVRTYATYALFHPGTELADKAMQEAIKYGDLLIGKMTPSDWVYANMPLSHSRGGFLQLNRSAYTGTCFISLYEMTGDKKYLDAAVKIAGTLKKTQLPEGRWYFRVEPKTGKPVVDYTSDAVQAMMLLDILVREYNHAEFAEARDKALAWILANPCRNYLWQQQYEDIKEFPPYGNLEWHDAGMFIEYLAAHADEQNGYEGVAKDLFRYIEDVFIAWQPAAPGRHITPAAMEQYDCYTAIDGHLANFIRVCVAMHRMTGDEIYLKKGRAMADILTMVQHKEGYYPTWMSVPHWKNQRTLEDVTFKSIWVNCTVYDAEILMKFARYEQWLKSPTRDAPAE